MGVTIVPPREDYGKHNLPPEKEIVVAACRLVSQSSLQNINILVTGGPTPVLIDSIRRITNRFSGQLGVEITEELYLRGANVHLIHGQGSYHPPDHLPYQIIETYDEYFEQVFQNLHQKTYQFGIFTAAVADYKPERVLVGKTPSDGSLKTINLIPTAKVIEAVKDKFPDLSMITFKYQENINHEQLIKIAQERLKKGYHAIVANRGDEKGLQGEQIAYLVTTDGDPKKMIGKKQIAIEIANHLEQVLTGDDRSIIFENPS
jgi:phosphopantothenoylcysteine decarboxylase / phosphopantothenate---cysteine ligase